MASSSVALLGASASGEDYDDEIDSFGVDLSIFLIDTTVKMFDDLDNETPFSLAIKTVRDLIRYKIMNYPNDKVAVILFGTERTKNESDFRHVYVLSDLEKPGVETVTSLNKLLGMSLDTFKREIGHSDDYAFGDVLWTASIMFKKISKGSKQLFIFTNNENPHANKVDFANKAKAKAVDLQNANVSIELMHLPDKSQRFDVECFYKYIVTDSDDNGEQLAPCDKLEKLMLRIEEKCSKKRRVASVDFWLGPPQSSARLGVSIFNLIGKAHNPKPVRLHKETNEMVTNKRFFVEPEASENLIGEDDDEWNYDGDLKFNVVDGKQANRMVEFGGRKIEFTPQEIVEMRQLQDKGLYLLGFKPIHRFKPYHFCRIAQFITPDEKHVKGSTSLFIALLDRCLARKMAPLCSLVQRKDHLPRLCYLRPAKPVFDDCGRQVIPPGFHVIYLPFQEDFRELDLDQEQMAYQDDDRVGGVVDELLASLEMGHNPLDYCDPALQAFWNRQEALALDLDEPEPAVDTTLPDSQHLDTVSQGFVQKLIDFGGLPDGYDPGVYDTNKRRAPWDSSTAAGKRPKDLPPIPDIIEQIARNNPQELDGYSMNHLREYLKSVNLRCPAKKADAISVIRTHALKKAK